jgi:hypothetical protein
MNHFRLKSAPVPRPDYYPSPDPLPFGWGETENPKPVEPIVMKLIEGMAIGQVKSINQHPRKASILDYVQKQRKLPGYRVFTRDWKVYIERVR